MKRNLLFRAVLFCFVILFLTPQLALAHFPATDKAITVILHVDPNDKPLPGQPATLLFLFGDTTHKFNLTKCTCLVTVTEQGKHLFSHSLLKNQNSGSSIFEAALPFVFPNRDVYKIVLRGQPFKHGAFQSFQVSWYFRVDQYPLQVKEIPAEQIKNTIAVCIVIIGSLLLLVQLLKKRKAHTSHKNNSV